MNRNLATRQFILESFRIFIEPFRDSENAGNRSKRLRDELKSFIDAISRKSSDDGRLLASRAADDETVTFQSIESMWHICEAYFFNHNLVLLWLTEMLKNRKNANINSEISHACSLALRGQLDDAWVSLQNLDERISSNNDMKHFFVGHKYCEIVRKHFCLDFDFFLESCDASYDFADWCAEAKKLMGSDLVREIPQLFELLQFLSGDRDRFTRSTYCQFWDEYALYLFLYSSPLPINQSKLTIILRKALDEKPNTADETSYDTSYLEDLIEGNVGPLLSMIHDLHTSSGDSFKGVVGCSSPQPHPLQTIAIASCVHLSYILVHGANLRDLAEERYSASNETTFPEEMMLQFAQHLNELDYPVELVVEYLHACSYDTGRAYARQLLHRRQVTTDEDVFSIASALRAFGFDDEAASMETARGVYYMNLGSRQNIVKGTYFFQLSCSPGMNRVSSILDRALWGCCVAVRSCRACFPSLSLNPFSPRLRNIPARTSNFDLNEIEPIDLDPFCPLNWIVPGEECSSEELMDILTFCDDLLGAIHTQAATDAAYCLLTYTSAVNKLLLALDATKMSPRDRFCLYKEGSNLLCDLIMSEILPMRCLLHAIELAVSVGKSSQLLFHDDVHSGGMFQFDRVIFSRQTAYDLSCALVKLETVFTSEQLLRDVKEESRNALRKDILGLIAEAVIQDNSNRAAQAETAASKDHMLSMQSKSKSARVLNPRRFGCSVLTGW